MSKLLYSYDADTKRAKVFSRVTGAVVCDVSDVNTYVGNMLSRLADEMYNEGLAAGRAKSLNDVAEHVRQMRLK